MSLASLRGKWGYVAGSAGTPAIPAGAQILRIYAAGGTFTINGGSAVTVPAGGQGFRFHHLLLVAPAIVFSGTSAYFVEYVQPS